MIPAAERWQIGWDAGTNDRGAVTVFASNDDTLFVPGLPAWMARVAYEVRQWRIVELATTAPMTSGRMWIP